MLLNFKRPAAPGGATGRARTANGPSASAPSPATAHEIGVSTPALATPATRARVRNGCTTETTRTAPASGASFARMYPSRPSTSATNRFERTYPGTLAEGI